MLFTPEGEYVVMKPTQTIDTNLD